MATKVTKWTRERGGRKDFADPTRRSHQRLQINITGLDAAMMRDMAKYKGGDNVGKRQEKEVKMESREDAVIRKRIEELRAQLHDVTLKEEAKQGNKVEAVKEAAGKTVKELQQEADSRRQLLARVRTFIPVTPSPITPKQRAHTIHTEMLEERARQVQEKTERVRQRQEEDARWARVVRRNRDEFEEDLWKEHLHKINKRETLKKDLDNLCAEREASREEERRHLQRLREEVENSGKVYLQYHHHIRTQVTPRTQAAQEKLRKRKEFLAEIEAVRASRLQEALKEDEQRESELRYSAAKRAYARKVKQRILDKMKGKRSSAVDVLERGRKEVLEGEKKEGS
ncbi:uncharacterized protein [Cherax quadricarinatus]|uniref:uncharacterized protein isoform X1 n=1 Tax=Cherax quadricarinatus TaxID=27406 RepID=UPI00387EE25A